MAREIKDFEKAVLQLGNNYLTDLTAIYNFLHDDFLDNEEKRHNLASNLITKIMNLQLFLDQETKAQEKNCATIEEQCSTIA